MVAIGYRGVTNASTTGGSVTPIAAIALPTGTVSGDMVCLLYGWKYSTSVPSASPTGWSAPTNNVVTGGNGSSGIDSGIIYLASYYREYDGVWTMPTLSLNAAPNVSQVMAVSYSKAANETWNTVECANASTSTGSATTFDPAASSTTLSLGAGSWLGTFIVLNSDAGTPTTPGSTTVTGVTFGSATSRGGNASSTGQDMRCVQWDQAYSSGTASAGPNTVWNYTSGVTTEAGAVVFYKLSVTAGPDFVRPKIYIRSQAVHRASRW